MTVEQAQTALTSARAAYQEEVRLDSQRSEGSGAQERRREERLDELRERVWQCEQDLKDAQRRDAGQP